MLLLSIQLPRADKSTTLAVLREVTATALVTVVTAGALTLPLSKALIESVPYRVPPLIEVSVGKLIWLPAPTACNMGLVSLPVV